MEKRGRRCHDKTDRAVSHWPLLLLCAFIGGMRMENRCICGALVLAADAGFPYLAFGIGIVRSILLDIPDFSFLTAWFTGLRAFPNNARRVFISGHYRQNFVFLFFHFHLAVSVGRRHSHATPTNSHLVGVTGRNAPSSAAASLLRTQAPFGNCGTDRILSM